MSWFHANLQDSNPRVPSLVGGALATPDFNQQANMGVSFVEGPVLGVLLKGHQWETANFLCPPKKGLSQVPPKKPKGWAPPCNDPYCLNSPESDQNFWLFSGLVGPQYSNAGWLSLKETETGLDMSGCSSFLNLHTHSCVLAENHNFL